VYTIDYSRAHYVRRRAWLVLAVAAVLALLFGAGVVAERLYREWSQPTLAQNLADYQIVAGHVVGIVDPWNTCRDTFAEIEPYYSLLWSESPAAVIGRLADQDADRPASLLPTSWSLQRDGPCELGFRLRFSEWRSRAAQRDSAEQFLKTALRRWEPSVIPSGGDVAGLKELSLIARFEVTLPDYSAVPPVPSQLTNALARISKRGEKIKGFVLGSEASETVIGMLTEALDAARPLLGTNAAAMDEDLKNMIDPRSFMNTLQRGLGKGADLPVLADVRTQWDDIATRRFRRVKALDNDEFRGELAFLSHLASNNLPAVSIFTDLQDKARVLRDAAEGGYSKFHVFDRDQEDSPRSALRVLSARILGCDPGEVRVDGLEPVERDGDELRRARWSLLFAPESGDDSWVRATTNSELHVVSELVQAIEADRKGFAVEKVALRFGKRASGGRSPVAGVEIVGVLPYGDGTNRVARVQVAESEVP